MAQEKYAKCPIYHKDVLFTDSKKSNIGETICTVDGLYCSGTECIGLKLEKPEPIKRDPSNLSLREMFGTTFEVVIPYILEEEQDD